MELLAITGAGGWWFTTEPTPIRVSDLTWQQWFSFAIFGVCAVCAIIYVVVEAVGMLRKAVRAVWR